jgi:uncharacterized protein (DUF305 family)
MLKQRVVRITGVPAIAFSLVLVLFAFTMAQPDMAFAGVESASKLVGNTAVVTDTLSMTEPMTMNKTDIGQSMQMMGQMMQMMGKMQDIMGDTMPMSCSMPMTGTMAMTGTMPMSCSMPMTRAMAMGSTDMSQMMAQMMNQMQTMMGAGMDMGAMGSSMPMTGTMPMTDTMPMTNMMVMKNAGMGHTMRMMGLMMLMMGEMQDMMGVGMGAGAMSADCKVMCQNSGMMNQMMGQMPSPSSDNMAMDTSTQPFDLLFIDGMILHHQGAIEMAKQAQTEAEHQEIKDLADNIIASQEAEINQMQEWRQTWYPDVAATQGMGMDMATMAVAEGDELYDLRFIAAMIPHHEGAIAMAKEALTKTEHEEIKTLAENIITAQEDEIAQMKEWQTAWSN